MSEPSKEEMQDEKSLRMMFKRSTVANAIAGFAVAAGVVYFIISKDTDSLKWVVGLSIGWLFKEAVKK
jgi:hypothetical protein